MGKTNDDQPPSSTNTNGAKASPKAGGFTLAQDPLIGLESEVAKYEVAPEPEYPVRHEQPVYEDLGELPASYQADALFLTARDPRWLFCYWDFDWTKVPRGAFRYGTPMFFLKISRTLGGEEAMVEVKPEARNWYVPVSSGGTRYFAELGYYNTDGSFVSCVRSGEASTPPDAVASEEAPVFVTSPAKSNFDELLSNVKALMEDGESLLHAIARITKEGMIAFLGGKSPTWSDEQRRLLAALLGNSAVERMNLGSAELDELLRKTLSERLHSEGASELSAVWQRALNLTGASSLFSGISGAWSGVTSWGLGSSWSAQPFSVRTERGFFMHVNAEVIFYGGTDPDATVWINGEQINLGPDGTFRYHFRLPDGDWSIPVVAQSPDKVEQRSATLSFQRATTRTGDVGATAQPAHLPAEPMGRR